MNWSTWTTMRHMMLAAVESGAVTDAGGRWQFTSALWTAEQVAGVCDWLGDKRLLEVGDAGQVVLTDDGQLLLKMWNSRHPEVMA